MNENDLRRIAPLQIPPSLRSMANAGKRPTLAEIPITQLRVETDYQREIMRRGLRNIRSTVADFRWSRFTPLIVAPLGEDGNGAPLFAVIDGQHRATALASLGVASAPCIVHALSQQARADAYSAINTAVTAMTPQARFFAMVGAGDETAVAVKAVCDELGIEPMKYGASSEFLKARQCVAVGALHAACARHGADILRAGLRLIVEREGFEPADLVAINVHAAVGAVSSDNRVFTRLGQAIAAAGYFDFESEAAR